MIPEAQNQACPDPPLTAISWKQTTPRLFYLYAKSSPAQFRRREMGWILCDRSEKIYHAFSNDADLGDYPSLDAAKEACETLATR